jgi:HEAT repeat protein
MLNGKDDPIQRGALTVASWPRNAPAKAAWRGQVMRKMAGLLQDNDIPLSIRGRIVAALAVSGDSAVASLFRQMLVSNHAEVRQLGAIGCGAIKDEKTAGNLNELLYDEVPAPRLAACLALAAINTPQTMEMIAAALLHGHEDVRRAAGEALAHNKTEGHPILREGAEHEDLLVRRAAVYGLTLVKEPWAVELLERIQIEDDQWVVRSTAGQSLEALLRDNPYAPKPLPDPADTPWLITFASERGKGLGAGQAAWEMMKLALREGSESQRLAAMDHFRQSPSQAKSAIPILTEMLAEPNQDIREAAVHTLWQLHASGVDF